MDKFVYNTTQGDIEIYRFIYPFLASNMYVLLSGHQAVVFDPHENVDLLRLLNNKGIEHVHILLTHEHYDHVSGVDWLKENTEANMFCQEEAACALDTEHNRVPAFISTVVGNEDRKDGGHRYQDFKNQFKPYRIKADLTFKEETHFSIDVLEFNVKSTPGHSPGSACYELNESIVFTGDSLLQYDRVILGFKESRKAQYEEKTLPYLQQLSKDAIIMPGHGAPFVLRETKNI